MSTHIKQVIKKIPAKHVEKITEKGRIWCEITACGSVAYETHLIVLAVISVLWIVVDIAVLVAEIAEEL